MRETMRRFAIPTLALLLFGASYFAAKAWAETSYVVSATATSQTIRFGNPRTSVSIYNCSDGTTPTCAGEQAYFRLFDCNQIGAGVTTTITTAATSSTPLALGESVQLTWNQASEPALYCAVSIICDTAETATVRVIVK